jgi:hypothetical protein
MTLRHAALALALATATCSPARPALAEPQAPVCGAYAELAETLRRQFGETPRLRAEENRGFVLEFFAGEDGGWTLVMRQGDRPGDRACAIAAGSAWRLTAGPDSAF